MYNQIDKNKFESIVILIVFVIFFVLVSTILSYVFLNDYFGSIVLGFFSFIISLIGSLVTYFFGDKIVLSMTGAQNVSLDPNYRNLNILVETLAIKAGLPKPQVYILPDLALNAFATGRDPEHGHVAITQGLLQTMTDKEIEAVIAHELGHIKNYDIRLMLIVSVLAGAITTITDLFFRGVFWGGTDNDNAPHPIMIALAFIVAILAPIIALIIQMSISRKREFLADATAVEITRYPQGLISALQKLSEDPRPVERATEGNAHMFIDFPLRDANGFFQKLFSTHPPIEERIEALRKM